MKTNKYQRLKKGKDLKALRKGRKENIMLYMTRNEKVK